MAATNASALMAVPQTTILDNFNRANESPLSGGGNWGAPTAPFSGSAPCSLSSNAVGYASSAGAAWWTPSTFGPDCEVYFTAVAYDSGNSGQFFSPCLCMDVASSGANRYQCDIQLNAFNTVVSVQLRRQGTGGWGSSSVGTSIGGFVPGGKMLLRKTGDMLEIWLQPPSGAWTRVAAINDTLASGGAGALPAGRLGFLFNSQIGQPSALKLDDFGGGAVTGSPSGITEMGATGKHDLVATFGSKRTPGGRVAVPEPRALARASAVPWWTAGPRQVAGQVWPRPS